MIKLQRRMIGEGEKKTRMKGRRRGKVRRRGVNVGARDARKEENRGEEEKEQELKRKEVDQAEGS